MLLSLVADRSELLHRVLKAEDGDRRGISTAKNVQSITGVHVDTTIRSRQRGLNVTSRASSGQLNASPGTDRGSRGSRTSGDRKRTVSRSRNSSAVKNVNQVERISVDADDRAGAVDRRIRGGRRHDGRS